MSETDEPTLLALTAQIVSAHVAHNTVSSDALPGLIGQTYAALAGVGSGSGQTPAAEERPAPAVPIKRSVFPDYIVCLEDGRKLKMLKRHLTSAYNMTADQYRERWGLPSDYPMVAPKYAERRSILAKRIGLGRKAADAETDQQPTRAAPGRRRAAKAA